MNKFTTLAGASLLTVLIAGSVVSPAYAWHPQGTIVKTVQNITAGGAAADANSAATALSAQPGDELVYSITVSNAAAPAAHNDNDMAFTVMTDTLPEGLELVNATAGTSRVIREDIGTIVPGKSVTKTYHVKVSQKTEGKTIENKACFTADSIVKDNKQQGCDVADIKVTAPVVTPAPTPTPTPVTTTTPTPPTPVAVPMPEELPNTGISPVVLMMSIGIAGAGYIFSLLRLKQRNA